MLTATERVWDYFCIIAAERGVTVGQLLSYVDRAMRLEPTWRGECSTRNLSSAVCVLSSKAVRAQAASRARTRV